MAATPPYLYSAPVGPNNYFFSDMLRSLVQTRNNETARTSATPTLTPTPTATPYGYSKLETKPLTKAALGGAVDSALEENATPAASLPPQDLVLPPPPPVWYPPLYAPYGIDPLHFFIDLRVSGHIYDRKKENLSPLSNSNSGALLAAEDVATAGGGLASSNSNSNSNLLSKQRHGSAFTVPIPKSAQNDAINLSAIGGGAGGGAGGGSSSTTSCPGVGPLGKFEHYANYMLQHLPRLYSQFAAAAAVGGDLDTKSESASACATDLCDDDSLGRGSSDMAGALLETNSQQHERDIDVEIIDSIKYRTDGESSRCSSNDEASVTQID
ncbi:uncharacterized protein LOC6584757 [Drosophila mojavensis]|uniref:uncharacterized protein LOC6584757 n=1 Tax=Drosophila mojavensis TaxID=7230 RepID=UPI0013EE96B9|nr:uncharacterized protein LOC6584757 [Drosophila mojavensis]